MFSAQKNQLNLLLFKKSPPKALIQAIDKGGYRLFHAETTSNALEILKKESFQVIIAALGINQDFSDYYEDLVKEAVIKFGKKIFIIIFSHTACDDLKLREKCFNIGANMVTSSEVALSTALKQINVCKNDKGNLKCPICSETSLSEDGLWTHLPLYHIKEPNFIDVCPVCKKDSKPNMQTHFRNSHGLCAKGQVHKELSEEIPLYAYALVVIHRKKDNKFLVVQEFCSSGFWLPGGRVDAREDLKEAAIREAKEEVGIDIKLLGVLNILFKQTDHARLRIVFYAEPLNDDEEFKTLPDFESMGASYTSFEDLQNVKVRSNEVIEWIEYVVKGKPIYGLEILG